MPKPLKIILLSTGALVLLGLVAIGVWLTVNRWPRSLEPELWSEAEFLPKNPPEPSAWGLLPQKRETPSISLGDLAAAEALYSLLPDRVDSPGDAQRFWDEAGKLMPNLVRLLKDDAPAMGEYRKILDGPPLVDMDPIAFRGETARLFYLQDLHELGIASVAERMMAGDTEAAFGFLFKMFQQDLRWTSTSRSLISQVMALHCLKADLNLTLLLRYRVKPSQWDLLAPVLTQFDLSQVGLRRALVYEYRLALKMAAAAVPEVLKKASWWVRASFNAAFIRRDLNQFYRQLDDYAKRPSTITEKQVAKLDEEIRRRTKDRWWWFQNPGGKLVFQIIAVNPLGSLRIFSQDREDAHQTIQKILTFKEEEKKAPPPEPESRPEEREEKPAPVTASPPPSSPSAEESDRSTPRDPPKPHDE